MKNLFNFVTIVIILLICLFGIEANAQTKFSKDATGNYTQVAADTTKNTLTGQTVKCTDGKTYPLYMSARGKLFFYRVSKTGNTYKVYLKLS